VDGVCSGWSPVLSGVPQGTVLGPLLFLIYINDLPDCITSRVRLFADDCLMHREIHNPEDQLALQKDLDILEQRANKWGMQFNPSKCNILSITYQIAYQMRPHHGGGTGSASGVKWTTAVYEMTHLYAVSQDDV